MAGNLTKANTPREAESMLTIAGLGYRLGTASNRAASAMVPEPLGVKEYRPYDQYS
jgi:hypothetical protein